ncbi:hypothetical protein FNV43_RR01660 [Rhamnella rubrinervis]|uniref:Uncharacterized protein n=1 Tax=Rhamnella rubrinervis TaxID=2594499 RepID=A0A8K0HSR1_9ROSA|nr:hypothetical protein FNV43_RR01660 [Rhamnella rubrinervis]
MNRPDGIGATRAAQGKVHTGENADLALAVVSFQSAQGPLETGVFVLDAQDRAVESITSRNLSRYQEQQNRRATDREKLHELLMIAMTAIVVFAVAVVSGACDPLDYGVVWKTRRREKPMVLGGNYTDRENLA